MHRRTASRPSPSALLLSLLIMAAAVARAGGTASPHGGSCPSACSCKWSGGKRTAECAGLSGSVPQHLPGDTQVLNLTGNILKTLPGGHFQQARLVHLQRIYLSRCGIVLMADDAFRGLNNLVELDLSHNFLTAVPKLAPYCPLLRRLQLSANPIQRLGGHSFRGLHSLVSLELSQCQLAWLETSVFADLHSLEVLRLDGNRLRSLPPDGLTLPPLHSLDLSDNPWHCDCNLRSLRQWMHQRNVPLSVPPRCEGPPRLARRLWSQLEPDDFACAPRVAASELRVGAVEGENATLQCDINSLPAANVRWLWRSRVIVNLSLISFGRQMYLLRASQNGRRQQTSTLTIINVMLKDSGRYVCAAGNRAGNQTANVTLIVRPRSADLAALSAPEIVGIVLGLLLLLALVAASACLLAVRRPRSSDAGSLQANSEEQSGSPAPLLSSSKKQATAKSGIVAAVLRGEYRTLRACRGANKEEEQGGASDVVTDALRVSAGAPRHELVCATRKRPPAIVANPLSPGARDSPDEGLGDEREYETDILD
ncbi:hypothetical protein MTO96_013027 [Rhipicephalus appendiculatus]